MSPLPELLTTEDVANYLKVDVVTVRRLVKRGELPAYRVGNEYRFTEKGILEFLERQRTKKLESNEPLNFSVTNLREEILPMKRRQGAAGIGRFTQRARRVLSFAEEEARKRGESEIGVFHLVYGCILEAKGVAGHVLESLNIDAQKIQALLPPIPETVEAVPQTLSAATKAAIARAVKEAHRLDHRYIDTGHLLLGLLDDADIRAMLQQFDVTPDQVRQQIKETLANKPPT